MARALEKFFVSKLKSMPPVECVVNPADHINKKAKANVAKTPAKKINSDMSTSLPDGSMLTPATSPGLPPAAGKLISQNAKVATRRESGHQPKR